MASVDEIEHAYTTYCSKPGDATDARVEVIAYLEGEQHHGDIDDGCVQVRAGERRLQASNDGVHADAQRNQSADNMGMRLTNGLCCSKQPKYSGPVKLDQEASPALGSYHCPL